MPATAAPSRVNRSSRVGRGRNGRPLPRVDLTPETRAAVARFDARAEARQARERERDGGPGVIGEVGHVGLIQTSGNVNEEVFRELQGDRFIRRTKEMMLDATVRTGLDATAQRIRRLDWTVVDAGPEPEEAADGDYLRSVLADMEQPWEQALDNILTFLPWGWAWCETPLKLRRGPDDDPALDSRFDDGLIGLRKIELRPQDTLDTWQFDARNRAIGMWQKPPGLYGNAVLIPLEPGDGAGGSLHFRTTSAGGNPTGEAWLRRVFVPWYYKAEFLRFLGQGVERDLAGIPIARIPTSIINAAGAPYDRWRRLITQLRAHRQAGTVIPGDRDAAGNRLFDIELLKGEGGKQFDLKVILEWLDRQILLGLGADWLLLGHGERGSWSLASERTHEHALRVASIARLIADQFNTVLIPRLFRLNPSLGRTRRLPRVEHGDIEGLDIAQVAQAYSTFALAGFPLGRADEDHFRRLAGLPARERNEEAEAA